VVFAVLEALTLYGVEPPPTIDALNPSTYLPPVPMALSLIRKMCLMDFIAPIDPEFEFNDAYIVCSGRKVLRHDFDVFKTACSR
jgi:hypothetical protein